MLGRLPRQLLRFWRGLATNWIGAGGVALTTGAFVLFALAELFRIVGIITNAYVGLLSYLTLPAVFVLGLLLIPLGWRRYRKQTGKTTRELLAQRFDPDEVAPKMGGARFAKWTALLTIVNVVFLGAASARMLHFMDQPEFCGTACHSVMHPEWEAYQQSPHAHVACVDCHVGQGAEAAMDAKLNGMWQMISVSFDLYERPIPTPVHNLRPARETCEQCHWPARFYGDRIKTIVHYDLDRASTPRYTTLALKVGSGKGQRRGEIHWHVAQENEVRYMPASADRSQIRWLEVRQPDGSYKRYNNRAVVSAEPATEAGEDLGPRVLDCVDCHNRATHIYEEPEAAVDERIARGEIDRALPFAKRQALAALTGSYLRGDDALEHIDLDFRGYYARSEPSAVIQQGSALDEAVASLQDAYRRNIHRRMNVYWGSYADHLGHEHGPGCRRCHSPSMVDEQGSAVPNDCTLCHSMLAYDSSEPFRFVGAADPDARDYAMHRYLQQDLTRKTTANPAPRAP